jgi:sulfonate transport system substrate-binding protein
VGKRVVMFKGTASQLLVDRLLEQNGLSERDFRMVTLDSSASITALANGDVDAVWGTLLHFDLRDRGLTRVVFGTQDPVPAGGQAWATSESGLIATDDFIARAPQLVQRIVDVLVREAAWSADPANHAALYELWARSGTPAAHFREEYERATPRVRLSPLLDEDFLAGYRLGVKQALGFRLIRTAVDVDAWLDRRFLDHALAALPQPHPWAATTP